MNKFILILLVCVTSALLSQGKNEEKCNCLVILIPKQEKIPLFDCPKGKVIDYLFNDTINENYVILQLRRIQKGYAFITGGSAIIDTVSKTGWVKKRQLGIYPSVYSEPVKLYAEPNKLSKIRSIIKDPQYFPFTVIGCNEGWLLVEYRLYDKIFKGWLPPDNQCANPYTTCN